MDAAGRLPALQQRQLDQRKSYQAEMASRIAGRSEDELAKMITAEVYNRASEKSSPRELGAIHKALGLPGGTKRVAIRPEGVSEQQILAALQASPDARNVIAAELASRNQGMGSRLTGLEIAANQALADQGVRGQVARGALFTGVGAGGTMGLTAAGQALMELMAYVESGQQQQDEREQPLM